MARRGKRFIRVLPSGRWTSSWTRAHHKKPKLAERFQCAPALCLRHDRAVAAARRQRSARLAQLELRRDRAALARRRSMKTFLGALALAALFATSAFAQPKTIITIGGSDKIVYLPAKLAERLGYFQAQGADVELRSEAAGVEARDALLSGAVQGVVGFYDHTIALQAKGKLVQSVVQFTVAPGEALMVSAHNTHKLHSPADLRGRIVGVTGLGSSTSFLTH